MGDAVPDRDRRKVARDRRRRSRPRQDSGFALDEDVELGDWDKRDLIRLPDTSGLAVASLAAAVLSVGLLLLASVPALVLGILALRKIRASRGRLGGANLAITAVILATLTTLLSVPVGIYLWDKMKDSESAWDRPAARQHDPWER